MYIADNVVSRVTSDEIRVLFWISRTYTMCSIHVLQSSRNLQIWIFQIKESVISFLISRFPTVTCIHFIVYIQYSVGKYRTSMCKLYGCILLYIIGIWSIFFTKIPTRIFSEYNAWLYKHVIAMIYVKISKTQNTIVAKVYTDQNYPWE